ncbi:Hypothetical predicted protein, partial [Olea europaea subsp. europaea]
EPARVVARLNSTHLTPLPFHSSNPLRGDGAGRGGLMQGVGWSLGMGTGEEGDEYDEGLL